MLVVGPGNNPEMYISSRKFGEVAAGLFSLDRHSGRRLREGVTIAALSFFIKTKVSVSACYMQYIYI